MIQPLLGDVSHLAGPNLLSSQSHTVNFVPGQGYISQNLPSRPFVPPQLAITGQFPFNNNNPPFSPQLRPTPLPIQGFPGSPTFVPSSRPISQYGPPSVVSSLRPQLPTLPTTAYTPPLPSPTGTLLPQQFLRPLPPQRPQQVYNSPEQSLPVSGVAPSFSSNAIGDLPMIAPTYRPVPLAPFLPPSTTTSVLGASGLGSLTGILGTQYAPNGGYVY